MKLRDERFCGDKGPYGAKCFWDLSGKEESYTPSEWKALRYGWICSSPETFADRQAALLKFCKDTNRCSYEEVQEIERYGEMLRRLK